MVGSFAEFERAMLRERTKVGLDTARREGRVGGRPPKLTPQQQAEIVRMISRGRKTAADAARLFGVHPATISPLLSRARAGASLSRGAAIAGATRHAVEAADQTGQHLFDVDVNRIGGEIALRHRPAKPNGGRMTLS